LSDSNKSLSLASVGQGTTSSIVQWLLCLISFGIAASALNNNWNGEKFIALETDVLWLHIVLGHYFISFAVFLAFEDFLDCFKNQGVGSLYGAIGLRVLD
jgi:hypothetical protein